MKTTTERLRLPVPGHTVTEVSAVVHRPSRPTGPALFLTHGAGTDLDDPGLVALADGVARSGHLVVRANLPFREAGRRSPPRADRGVGPLRAVFEAAREAVGPRRAWAAGGKSYGGRVASMAAAEGLEVAGLVFYGYPLHPAGKPEQLRVEHWSRLRVPCLFLQGSADPMCDLDVLEANLRKLGRRAEVKVVEGGDHSLNVTARRAPDGRRREAPDVVAELGSTVSRWLAER